MQNEIDRIRQYLPFDALKCIDDIIKNNNINIDKINIDRLVKIKYFYKTTYTEITDIITKIDKTKKCLYLKNTIIKFEDIINIENI